MINSNEIKKNLVNNQAFFHSVINKANQDLSFKTSLLADPDKTINEFNPRFKLPSEYKIVVEDQPDLNTVYVDIVKSDEIELTNEELEMVAGGRLAMVAGGSNGCVCVITW